MNKSGNATHAPPPSVVWAQRRETLLLTIKLNNCIDPVVEFKDASLFFKGKGGDPSTDYEVLLEFNKEIDPETSKWASNGREIKFTIIKTEDSLGWWPRLLKDSKKMHFLKTDFNNWKEEDDTDDEEEQGGQGGPGGMGGMPGGMGGMGGMPGMGGPGGNMDLESMMAQMGGMGGMGGAGGMPPGMMGGMGGMPPGMMGGMGGAGGMPPGMMGGDEDDSDDEDLPDLQQ